VKKSYRVAIIGAGLAGLGMAMRLKADGEDLFVILEKSDRVGGTWRDNSYPGAACDIQSHLYWYAFDTQPDWSHVYCYCAQPEILSNIERPVQRSGLKPHPRFNAEIAEARWDDLATLWHIRTATGGVVTALNVVTARGQLNRPSFGGIERRASFEGVHFHSSRWRHDVDLACKRVAAGAGGDPPASGRCDRCASRGPGAVRPATAARHAGNRMGR